jgi:hypothetical protein
MDPKANLKEQLAIAHEITDVWDNCNEDAILPQEQLVDIAEQGYRLAELVIVLDSWIRNGGFSPWEARP